MPAIEKSKKSKEGEKSKEGRVKSTELDTKTARAKLGWAPVPYFVAIDQGIELGYRKGKLTNDLKRKPGAWVMRRYIGGDKKTKHTSESIGVADDFANADGAEVLTFWQAQAKVRVLVKPQAAASEERAPQTVGDAVREYVADRIARNPTNGRDAHYRLETPVLADKRFAGIPLAKLTADDLGRWRKGLSKDVKAATVRRTINDLRAALSAAVERDWRNLPDTIRGEIKSGLKPPDNAGGAARHALLTDADIRHIVDAAFGVDADFGALVLVLAATGARYSQAARITVAGLQVDARRLMVPASAKGKGEKQRPEIAVPVGNDVIERLQPRVVGRAGHEPLLMRTDRRATKEGKRAPWDAASLMQRPWRKALALAGVAYVEPYALRHSSIVRMLLKNIPVRIVAGLHDTSMAMIERHYSADILNMADELARQAIVPMTTAAPTPLRAVG
jgi:integrase